MSFDIYLTWQPCEACGRDEAFMNIGNVTHNVNGMVEKVFEGVGSELVAADGESHYKDYSWGRFEGHVGGDVLPLLGLMMAWFRHNEDLLVPMNPENGWGSTKCVERILTSMIDAIKQYPKARIHTSG